MRRVVTGLVLLALSAPMIAVAAEAPALRIEVIEFEAGKEKVAAERGRFSVPENRAKPGGRTIELTFVRFKSTAAKPGPPIVYLAGGPGGSGTGAATGARFPLFLAMREFGDVLAFDQRGTGQSGPDLSCPNTLSYPFDRAFDRAARESALVAAASACAESLKARGHDLSAYNTNESADDLESLRRALGAEKLTLWGISYGTHLSLAMMKRHPDSIDRVILAGIEGLDHTYKLPSDQQRLLEAIGRLAAADPTIGPSMPDLVGSIRGLLARLEREPLRVEMVDPTSQQTTVVVLGPFDLQLALAGMLQGPDTFAGMPDLIARLEKGDWMALAMAAVGDRSSVHLHGMSFAMDCASGMSRPWRDRIAHEAKSAVLADAINWPYPELCTRTGVPDAGDAFRAPLRSSIPALLISGTLDGRTPPSNAEEVIPGLAKSVHLVIEGAGHSDPLFLSSPRILETMQAFMRGKELPTRRITLPAPRFTKPRQVAALPAADLDRLAGLYRMGPMDVHVVRAGTLLFALIRDRPYALRPEGGSKFFVEGTPAEVAFVDGSDGAVARLELRQTEGAEPQVAVRAAAGTGR